MQLTEIETTVLDKPNEPCTVYSAEREESVKRFSQCCKNAIQVSISPTFYEQLLRQNPFAKKITNPNCKHIIAAQKNFRMKKQFVRYWWNWHQETLKLSLSCSIPPMASLNLSLENCRDKENFLYAANYMRYIYMLVAEEPGKI